MTTYSKETALYDTGAIASGITDAGNTANTYITAVDQNGIKVHAANNVNSNYSKINAEGMEVYSDSKIASKFGKKGDEVGSFLYDGQGNSNENVIASFTDGGSVIGKDETNHLELKSDSMKLYDAGKRDIFSVLTNKSDNLGTVYECPIGQGNNGNGVGTYTYPLCLPYEGGLEVELLFYNEADYHGGYGGVFRLNDGDFGDFAFSGSGYPSGFSATGNISFDTATNTITLVISSLTSGYQITRFLIEYTSYPQYPSVYIGPNANKYDSFNTAFAIADALWDRNALSIDRTGNIKSLGNVTAENLQYNNTGIDTLTLKNYKVNGYVSTSTTGLYVTITTPKSMENISSILVTKSGATCGVRGVSGYVKDGSTSMEDGYSLNKSAFTLAATKNDDYHFTLAITRSSAFSNVTNNTPVSLHIGNMVFTFN